MRSIGVLALALCACDPPPAPDDITCGAGTVLAGNVCLPNATTTCGSGTHEDSGQCVADPRFALYAHSIIKADGWTGSEVRVVGTLADGSSAHDVVVVSASPATAGAIVSPTLALGDLGAATTFMPCTSFAAGCSGNVHFAVARVSDPQTILATAEATLEAPPAIGSVQPCLGGGNVAYFEGQNFGITGTRTYTTQATFDVQGAANRATVHIVVPNSDAWGIVWGTAELGIPMIASTYQHGKGIGYAVAGQPIFDMTGPGTIPEADFDFQIHEFTFNATSNSITALTASFNAVCTYDPTRTLTGCVHFAQ